MAQQNDRYVAASKRIASLRFNQILRDDSVSLFKPEGVQLSIKRTKEAKAMGMKKGLADVDEPEALAC